MIEWSTACPDWESRVLARQSLIPLAPLFPAEADAGLRIFRDLRIVDVGGSPTMGEACRPWVFDFVSAIFGAYNPETGRRLIRNFFLLVAKKNSKSTTAAGIMLTALIRNWRISGEFLILAPTLEVANNSFKPAYDMVRGDPELSDLLHLSAPTRTITHHNTGATLKVVAADNETVSGKKAIGVLIEELWLFGKKNNAHNMLLEATGGLASHPEGFVIYLSTQSDAPPAGVFRQKLREFRDIRDGHVLDPRSLGILYEFPKRMLESREYREPRNFYVTNPNLGKSVDEQYLIEEFDRAERAGQEEFIGFLAKHLNVEIGLGLRTDGWAGAEYWIERTDKELTFESLLARSDVVTVGIDGGGLDDLLGLAVLGREKETGRWLAWCCAYAHEIVFERRKSITTELRGFEAAGDLAVVDCMEEAFAAVAGLVAEVEAAGLLAQVGLDPIGVAEIVSALAEHEIEGDERVVGISQGYRLGGTIKGVEVKLADGALAHADQALMTWCVGNARVEPRGNSILITKQASGTAKIDPLMALFNAAALMEKNPEPRASAYADGHALMVI